MADEYVVLKGSRENGKLAWSRSKGLDGEWLWDWVPVKSLPSTTFSRGHAWKARRLDEETAKQWAASCKGRAVLASTIPGLPEYIQQK